jgi:hypothetical protein
MSRLAGLDPNFVEGNVALGVLLGALGACATIRAALPAPNPPKHASMNANNPRRVTPVRESEPDDAFVALLLGAVVLHERLSEIVDRELALEVEHSDADAPVDARPVFRGGLLR